MNRKNTLTEINETLSKMTLDRGLNTRPSQNQMISSIADMLITRNEYPPEKGSNLLVVEAPTGTGKSFGYLIPALPAAMDAGKTIVVSTAVVSLQEQLFEKDLPALQKAMHRTFTYAVAKGRSRFVCPSRLKQQNKDLEEQGSVKSGDFSVGGPKEEESKTYVNMLSQWNNKKWNGELETLKNVDEEQRKVIWPKVTTDSSGCSGKSCKDFKACPYFEAKKTWQNANVIIANHDLVMSDIKLGMDGTLLSPIQDTIYIFDEAHHLPGKARDAWSHAFKTDTFSKIIKEVPINLNDIALRWKDSGCQDAIRIADKMFLWKTEAQQYGKALEKTIKKFDDLLKKLTKDTKPREPFIIPYTDHLTELHEIAKTYIEEARSLHTITQNVSNEVNKVRSAMLKNGVINGKSPFADDLEMNKVLGAFGFYNNKFANLIETLVLFNKEQPEVSKPPIAKWIVPDDKYKSFSVHATPTMATDILPKYLYDTAYAVIHASATITSVGGFNLYKQKTGLQYYPNAKCIKLDSPFDFKKNAVLSCADLGVSPSDVEKHTTRLAETIPIILDKKTDLGTLILFSSKSQLEQVYARLPLKYRSICKVQYTDPNQTLIEAHKKDVDNGKRSILMGTQSFSEGLDLPGAWCSHVMCTKIPFSMPDNPIDKTLALWMESQNRSVFKEIAIPEASERLIQQSGRLLRREDDSGQFTILDNRLTTKWNSYGKLLVDALPPFSRHKWDLTKETYKTTEKMIPVPSRKPIIEIESYDPITLSELGDSPW